MNIMTFILELQKKHVFLAVNSGKLSVDAPKGALDSQTLEKLKLHKNEIIEHLSKLTKIEEEIQPVDNASNYPLSFAQQRLWFIDQVEQGSASYNIPWAFEVKGKFDLSIANRALNAVIEKHQILRTIYINDAGEGRQQILADFNFSITELDFTQDLGGIQAFIEAEAGKPFDLTSELVLRVNYLKTAPDSGVMVFNIHHIAFDEWSRDILLAEFVQNYSQLEAGKEVVQEDLFVQYRDFAAWQRKQLDNGTLQSQLDYWHKQLADAPVTHGLALQRNRPETSQQIGSKYRFTLPAHTKVALDNLARSQSVTPFVLIHAIFSLMLTKATRNSDVVIGTPSAGRSNSQLEQMIGFFVNFLSLRTDVDGHTSFGDYLEYVKQVNLAALQHQDVPFDRVLEHCGIERNTQMAPLFQIVLSVHQSSQAHSSDMPWDLSPVNIEHASANFDLMLEVGIDSQSLELMFTYDSALFSAQYIESLSQYFCTVCDQVIENKDINISDIQLINAQQQGDIVDEVLRAHRQFTTNSMLHQQFEEMAVSHPTRVAVCDDDCALTYQALNEQANRLARYLQEQGTHASDRVGICLSRSTEFVVAMLAILKAGGTYVPMDPSYPAARLTHIINDSDINLVVTSEALQNLPVLDTDQIKRIVLDGEHYTGLQSGLDADNLNIELPENLVAYIIYTSGSSGLPKGVQVTHKNVLRLFKSSDQQFEFSEQDVWSCFHSTAFDFSVWELWGALLYGAKTVMVSYEDSRSPQQFAKLLTTHGVTVLSQTASAFYQLSEYVREHNSPHQLRYVVFGGEYLNFTKLLPWMDRYGSEAPQLINMYGITETTVHVTYQKIERAHCEQGISLIGKPLQDLTCYVVDENGNCQPPGVPGELWVGGQGVTNGYLNRPELNTEKFIADPFSAEPNAVIYRSGDLVRWLDDLSLQYLGRIDEQVKIRGFRIELGEIEASLNSHPQVKSCAVLAKSKEQSGHELVVYFTLTDELGSGDQQALFRELHGYLQVKLPKHMVPAAYVMLDDLPMTVNGKLNRSLLLSMPVSYISEEYQAPETPIQRQLCAVFEQTLECEKVGIQDNFFNLGGDSIRAISLVANAANIGLQFSVKDVFNYQSVASLADAIERNDTESTTKVIEKPFALLSEEQQQALPQITTAAIEDAFPLTATQQGMVIHNMLEASDGTYHDVSSSRLKLQWQPDLFVQALSAVVERHSVLRSTFESCCSQPIQVIHESIALPLAVRAMTDEEVNDLAQYEQQCLALELASPFEMGDIPWRMAIHTIADDDVYLHLSFHHALLDGWSLASFNTELFTQYKRLLSGQPLLLQSKPPAFSLQIAQEVAAIESGNSRQYFEEKLDGMSLPWWSNLKKGALQEASTALSSDQRRRLKDLSKQLKVTEKSILLSAHTVLMALLDGQKDVVTSVVTNGRPELEGSEQTLGLYLNSLPMRIDVTKGTWQQLIEKVHSESVDLMSHRSYPLSEVQRATNSEFSSSLFNFIDFHVYESILGDVDLQGGNFFEKINFMLYVTFFNSPADNSLGFRVNANLEQFDQQYVEKIKNYLHKIISQILDEPSQEIDFDSFLDTREVERMAALEQQSIQSGSMPAPSVIELFERSVEQNPSAIAVTMADQSLTYLQLNDRVNNLACALREEEVGENDKVGIFLPRSIESLIAVLAVMRAGACYVPLDVKNPAMRNQAIIEQTHASVVISHESHALPFSVQGISELVLEEDVTDDSWLEDFADDETFALPDLQQNAYVLFTSGSTGTPKGIEISHANLASYLDHVKSHYFVTASQSLVSSTLSFDATISACFGPLSVAGTVNIVAEQSNDAASIAAFIKDCEAPCIFKVTPSHLDVISAVLGDFSSTLEHVLIIGGEALHWKAVNEWRTKHLPQATYINEYGPTESTVGCCFEVITPSSAAKVDQENVAIGVSVAGTSLYVFNDQLQRIPFGSVGELFIAGSGLSKGYLNRPDLTEQAFITKNINGTDTVLYRTGDLVRYLSDGKLEYIGRRKAQIKIRGYRIDLDEIKHHILAVKGVKAAFVAKSQGAAGQAVLVAYYTAQDGASLDTQILQNLTKHLPEYMVPKFVVAVDEFKLTLNGKVDSKALPDVSTLQGSSKVTEPESSLEVTLRNVWASVLRVAPDTLDVMADFFELGGDSILAIQIVAKARHQGVFFSLADLFKFSTIRSLSGVATTDKELDISQEAVTGEMPLLPVQQAFLQKGVELDYYNQAVMLNTPPEFNAEALQTIVAELVNRHDALRLSFKHEANNWQASHQDITTQSLNHFFAVEKCSLSDKEQVAEIVNRYHQSFELAGPLARFVYVEDEHNAQDGRLFIVLHHLVVDGVSWRILLSDIEAAFSQLHAFGRVQLAPKSSSYKAWGEFLQEYASDEQILAQIPYWQSVVATQSSPLPVLESQSSEHAVAKSQAQTSFSKKETQQLITQAILKYDLQVNELLLSSLLIALHQWSGGNQFLIDMEGHGREALTESLDLTETVGWFTSIYPVLLAASNESLNALAYEKIIHHVKETYRAIPSNGIGFGVIANSEQSRELGDYAPAQIQFNYLGQFDNVTEDGEFFSIATESAGDWSSANRPMSHKLDLIAMVTNGSMQFKINFDLSDFSQQQADSLASHLQKAVQGIISHCVGALDESTIAAQFPHATAPIETLSHWHSQHDALDIYPATGMQKGLLFHSELDSSAYVTQIRLDFEYVLPEMLKLAWHNIVNRHDIFKTAFVGFEEGYCHQLVQHEVELNWSEVSLVHLDAAAQQEEVERIRCQDAGTKFNIVDAPLMRFHLLNLGENGHVLIWSHHHSLMDGWSMSMVFQEVAKVYEAALANKPITLPAVAPYKNYIQWLNQQDQAASLTFWKAQLSEAMAPTPLPLMDSSKVAESEQEFALQLNVEQTQSLVEFARKTKTTLNSLLQSSWAILLSRYSSESTVTFGYTTTGRPPVLENVGKMVGLFINSLPCRVTVEGSEKVEDFLISQRDALSQREQHNFISATEIQTAANSHGTGELYNSVIVFENYPIKDVSAHVNNAGLVITDVQPYARTNFPLSLIAHLGDTLSIRFEYHLGQYSAADIETVGQQLKAVLLQLVEKAQARVCDIDLAVDAAVETLQESESGIASTPFFALNDKVAEYAQLSPNAPAVSSQDGALTYDALATKVACLSVVLQDEGLAPGQAVGICMERSVKSTVAMLAVLKAGGFYVPIDAKTPSARINHIIDDCGMELMLVDEHTVESVPLDGVDFMMLDDELFDEDWYQCSEQELQDAKTSVQSSDTAYVIYTSGSTGKPKGVAVSHANLAHYLNYAASQYFDGVNGAVVSTSLSFDATITSLFTPLVCGKEVVLIEQGSRELDSLAALIANAASPMLFKLTPSHLNALAKLYDQPQTKVEHMCIVGGENLSWGTVDQWRNSVMPNACIINEYGPTEATVGCVVFKVSAHESAGQTVGSVPIGVPIHNTVLRVLDKDGRAVPKGAKGELYIGGEGVTQGYMNRLALTQEKFIEFSDDTTQALTYYRTGDVVRYKHDGNLEFISRVDEQVKVRGYRIETGEIEHHLLSNQSISAAHVMLDDTAAQHLVAYIACDVDMDLVELERSLRTSLALELNDYMCPSQYVFLAQLPLTANGKVDRKALPKWQAHTEQTSSSGPVGEIENQLANIWAQLLEVELAAITQDSDFFLLGGHSLLAIQLITAIRETFNVEVSLHQLFDASSLSGQGEVVEQADAATFTPAIQPMSLDMTHYPLTHAQERLWFIDQMGQGSSQYNMPLAFEVSGQFDVELIEQTLGEIVARHQVLRSNFVTVDEQPQVTYEHAQPFKLHRVDVSHLDAQARQHEVAQIQFENATKVFDLAKDLLVRASYVKLTNGADVESGALLLCFHHIVFDGWSIGILMKEFNTIYAAKSRQVVAELTPLAVQYQDYAVWQRTWEGEQQYLADQTYWTEALAGSPQIHSIPTDKVRPARQSFAGSAVPFKLDQAQTNKLKAFCQSRGLTMSMALQTVFSVLLNRYSGESDILFGTPVANRDRKEVEPLIGFFVNLVVMRVGVEPQSSFDSLLQMVKQTSLAAQSHQSYPFDKLVSDLDITRSASHAPLVQVIFSMNTNKVEGLAAEEFAISPMHAEQLVAKVDLSLDVEEFDDEVGFSLGYCTDLFETETIEQMGENYLLIIENMLSMPELQVAQALVNQRTDRNTGRDGLADSDKPFVAVHEAVKCHAVEAPEALALIDGSEQLTYGQLAAAARAMSVALYEQGVRAGSLVGVIAENSVSNVVLMVALSQMGAVYMPFDQRLPVQRIEQMIESSGVEHLIVPATHRKTDFAGVQQLSLDGLYTRSEDNQTQQVLLADKLMPVEADQLAYVIHTSGSTGVPKGVMIEHLALTSFVRNHNHFVGTQPQSRVMSVLSPAFDAGLGVIWSSLYSGATLCLASFEQSLSKQLIDFEVQQISLTPSILESLSWQSEFKLETLILGGEACPESTVEKWQQHCRLINEYGPTETTVTAMASDWSVSNSRSLGDVYPGFEAAVLDENGHPCPVGAIGELYLAGDQLARGYINAPELTAKAFIEMSLPGSSKQRYYKTGDLVRILPSGEFSFIGRADTQVKIRGFRIELEEIENKILLIDGVEQVVVDVCVLNEVENIVAYFVAIKDIDKPQFKEHLTALLPDYMVPNHYVSLEAMPLTVNGKVDRKSLPVPQSLHREQVYVAPTSELERQVCAMWQELLQVEQVGLEDNFFDLGGHSLLAARMYTAIQHQFDIELSMQEVLEQPVVSELVKVIDTAVRLKEGLISQHEDDSSDAEEDVWEL
ncbi:non-ribosomal peptide synthetase [Pseudoalteromonas obscura]|uniref:Amino acid adenylation domain-containing protein n=1 Tax=Pseudoalteromonas obscura TaxID=3048491 RepID=A0ABT7EH35_9GAMM|nr:non-ribosomal peptide synthetase [Pseudoalteromonas sp. P94(2023)]MDK2594355.1 amino acid adenylation domain-containing protein [Pseudoalteromonas sp. P94(2023)]